MLGCVLAIASNASATDRLAPINSRSLCPSSARLSPSMTIGCDSQTYIVMVSTQLLFTGIGGVGADSMVLRSKSLRVEGFYKTLTYSLPIGISGATLYTEKIVERQTRRVLIVIAILAALAGALQLAVMFWTRHE